MDVYSVYLSTISLYLSVCTYMSCVCMYVSVYGSFKELVHVIVRALKSQICMAHSRLEIQVKVDVLSLKAGNGDKSHVAVWRQNSFFEKPQIFVPKAIN